MNVTEDYAVRLAKVMIYRQHIRECEFPDEMERLFDAYLKNGEQKFEETIESQYGIDIIKKANFQAGSMFGEMNTFGGKIRQFCIIHNLGWIYNKPILLILLVLIIVVGYDNFFRYEYKLYNMPGKYEYRVKEIKLDKLTGKAQLKIIDPVIEKHSQKIINNQQTKGSGLYDDLLVDDN